MSDTLHACVCERHEQAESKSARWNRTRNPRLFGRLCCVLCSFVWVSCVIWCRMFRRDQRLQWVPFSNYSQSQSRRTILNAKEHLNLYNVNSQTWMTRSQHESISKSYMSSMVCLLQRICMCLHVVLAVCLCVYKPRRAVSSGAESTCFGRVTAAELSIQESSLPACT